MSFDKFAADLLTKMDRVADSIDNLVASVTWTSSQPPPPEVVTADITPDPEPAPEPEVKKQAAPAPAPAPVQRYPAVDVMAAQTILVKFCQENEKNSAKICGYLEKQGVTSMSELTDEGRGQLVSFMKREASNGSRPSIS